MTEKKFLTLVETALVTGVAKRSLQRLVANDRFPAVRFGRSVRIPVAALDAMAETAIKTSTVDDLAAFASSGGTRMRPVMARARLRELIAHRRGPRRPRRTHSRWLR